MEKHEEENADEKDQGPSFKDIPDHIKDYVSTKIAYYKLVLYENIAQGAAVSSSWSTIIILSLFFLLFFSMALALFIGQLLNEAYLGFLIVAGVYLTITLIVFSKRKSLIEKPVTNIIITKLANPETDGQQTKENK